jgi:hypothetical protein
VPPKEAQDSRIGLSERLLGNNLSSFSINREDAMSQTAEIIKAVVNSWPIAMVVIVWILRQPFRILIEKVEKITIGHGETKAEIQIGKELAEATKAVPPLNDEKTQTLMLRVQAESKATAFAHPRVRNPQQEKQRRLGIGYDLGILERLTSIAEKLPRAAITESWEILKRNIVETAKVFGFTRVEGGGSDMSQAVNFLTVDVLQSQEFMIGVYALATALQKVDKNPNADLSVKEAQDFVRACMTILRRLLLHLEDEQ